MNELKAILRWTFVFGVLNIVLLHAQPQPVRLVQANRLSNMGKEFFVSFPSVDGGGWAQHTLLYMACPVDCRVQIVSNDGAFYKELVLKANVQTEYELPSTVGVLFKGNWLTPAPIDQVFEGRGVHVSAEFPITATAVLNCMYTSDSFMLVPLESLGTDYIVTTLNDQSWVFGSTNNYENRPPQILIVATENGTKVDITLGGNSIVTTMADLTFGRTVHVTLNKGDVYFMATKRKPWDGDMTGTVVHSSARVAVYSGHLGAYVPTTDVGQVDYLAETQLPTHAWGNTLLVPRNVDDQKSFYSKLLAAQPGASIYVNGSYARFIQTAGGSDGMGYISQYANAAANAAICYRSDKPIAMTVFGSSNHPDAYQMNISSAEQFGTMLYGVASSSSSGQSFDDNRLGVVFPITKDGSIPDDLEIAFPTGDQWNWQKFTAVAGPSLSSKDIFVQADGGTSYGYKEINLPLRTFCLRCSRPVGCYSHGSATSTGFGTQGALMLNDRRYPDDQTPPSISYVVGDSTISGKASDNPTALQPTSYLAKLFLNYGSTNVALSSDPILNDLVAQRTWTLQRVDPNKEAHAYLTICDRAGNDTTIEFRIPARRIVAVPNISASATIVCVGESVELSCDSGFKNLQWSTGDTSAVLRLKMTKAGVYAFSLRAQTLDGDSTKTNAVLITVRDVPAVPTISQSLNRLTATAQPNSIYRWYDNNQLVSKAATNILDITHAGRYAVRVEDRSTACQNADSIIAAYYIIEDVVDEDVVSTISPNPCFDHLRIRQALRAGDEIEIVSLLGAQVAYMIVSQDQVQTELDLSHLDAGTYVVLVTHGGQTSHRVIVRY